MTPGCNEPLPEPALSIVSSTSSCSVRRNLLRDPLGRPLPRAGADCALPQGQAQATNSWGVYAQLSISIVGDCTSQPPFFSAWRSCRAAHAISRTIFVGSASIRSALANVHRGKANLEAGRYSNATSY